MMIEVFKKNKRFS